MRHNAVAPDAFAVVVKVTNHTGLVDTELAWCFPSASWWICWGYEDDQSHWTGRCRARLIFSWFFLPDLPRLWRWPITVVWEISSSPDTFQVLLTGFAEVMKVTNHTGLGDAELSSIVGTYNGFNYLGHVIYTLCMARMHISKFLTQSCRTKLRTLPSQLGL